LRRGGQGADCGRAEQEARVFEKGIERWIDGHADRRAKRTWGRVRNVLFAASSEELHGILALDGWIVKDAGIRLPWRRACSNLMRFLIMHLLLEINLTVPARTIAGARIPPCAA
jgi:hypothetical protein